MSKITYSSLKLKNNNEVKKFTFNDKEIEVLQYLPIQDKYSLINITIQKAKESSIYNPILLDTYFHLYIVMMYTNITFTDKQQEDLLRLYDEIQSNGLLEQVLLNMNEAEYNKIYSCLNQQLEDTLKYQNTIAGIISNIIENLPIQAEEMQKIVDNFNPEKFESVINFAKSINNGNLPE